MIGILEEVVNIKQIPWFFKYLFLKAGQTCPWFGLLLA